MDSEEEECLGRTRSRNAIRFQDEMKQPPEPEKVYVFEVNLSLNLNDICLSTTLKLDKYLNFSQYSMLEISNRHFT